MAGNTAADAAAWFASLAREIPLTMDEAIQAALDNLISQLEPVTPVVTGLMKASYTIGTTTTADMWELLNTAQAPDGEDYPGVVFFDPTWSRSYGILNATLNAGIVSMEASIDAALTAL